MNNALVFLNSQDCLLGLLTLTLIDNYQQYLNVVGAQNNHLVEYACFT
jgi:hypothetical protein